MPTAYLKSQGYVMNPGVAGSDPSSGSALGMVWEVRITWKRKAKGSFWGLKRKDQAGGGDYRTPVTE